MGRESYYVLPNVGNTAFIGNGYTPDGTFPANAIPCTQAQAQNYHSYIPDTSTTPPSIVSAAESVLLAQAQAAQSSTLNSSYKFSIASITVSVNGAIYTLAMDAANAAANLNAAISAQQALQSPAWASDTSVAAGELRTVSGVPLFCVAAGTTGASTPTPPTAIGTEVADGAASWEIFARSTELADGSYAWFTAQEIVSVGQQIELYLHTQKKTLIGLLAQVQAATTVADVRAVVWA